MNDFSTIDRAIESFRKDKQDIYVSNKAKSDWSVFQYRSIEWKQDSLNCKIEIFPQLDADGNSSGWNLTMMVFYEENQKHFFVRKDFIEAGTFEMVENKLPEVLHENYAYTHTDFFHRDDLGFY